MKCGAFDSGLSIHPDGKVSPCCVFDRNYFQDLHELDWNDPWSDLRDGRGCDACKFEGVTYRDSFNGFFNDSYKIRHLDIRNNNLCNLECSICNSYYSSKWAERLGKQKFVSTEFDIDLSTIESIYFAGGEPLLNPTHWKILDSIPHPERVSLQYSTNGSVTKNIEKYWPKFRDVLVCASMDAHGQLGEYLRYGTDWKKFEFNLDTMSKYATVKIVPTVSVLNIFHLENLVKWSKYEIEWNCLTGPDYLCVSVLPTELKKQIPYVPDGVDQLQQLLEIDASNFFAHTVSYVLLQDKLKGTDVWSYLPFEKYAIQEYMQKK